MNTFAHVYVYGTIIMNKFAFNPWNGLICFQELLGVAFNQMVRMTVQTGELLKTWRYQHMKSWSVNWEIKQVHVSFEEEDIFLQCLTADCKVVHEFIGGYIFLSMRSGNRNQTLNEELFHKLTGGWLWCCWQLVACVSQNKHQWHWYVAVTYGVTSPFSPSIFFIKGILLWPTTAV